MSVAGVTAVTARGVALPFSRSAPVGWTETPGNQAAVLRSSGIVTPRKPHDTQVSHDLDRAADLLALPDGWVQNSLYSATGTCALGAIMTCGTALSFDPMVSAVLRQVMDHSIPVLHHDQAGRLCAWNNSRWRAQEEVVSAFRDAAVAERMKQMSPTVEAVEAVELEVIGVVRELVEEPVQEPVAEPIEEPVGELIGELIEC